MEKEKIKKSILIISDLHLGAGVSVGARFNFLEDFYYDQELVEFLEYFSNGDYKDREVEIGRAHV